MPLKLGDQGEEQAEVGDLVEAVLVVGFRGGVFVSPGIPVGDVDGLTAQLDDGEDVGAQGVAHHEQAFGWEAVALEDVGIHRLRLIRHDLDLGKIFLQTGAGQFGSLIMGIALGDEHERVGLGEGLDAVLGVGQQLDRGMQHLAGKVDHPG